MSRSQHERQRAQKRGRTAEWIAAAYLFAKGYRILQMRFRVKAGEIDLIARKRDVIAIVEVKARRNLMAAVDAVGFAAQRRIANAASIWLSRQPDANRLSLRFDIVAVRPWRLPAHLKDAF